MSTNASVWTKNKTLFASNTFCGIIHSNSLKTSDYIDTMICHEPWIDFADAVMTI